MKRILILLPGDPIVNSRLDVGELMEGSDIYGRFYKFRKSEFVNNLVTIEAIRKASPEMEIIVRHVTQRANPFKIFMSALKIRQWCRKENIAIVHQMWGGPGAWSASYFLRVPYVLSLLGSDLLGAYNTEGGLSLKGRFLRIFSLAACGKAKRIIVMSEHMLESLPKGMQSRAIVIPEGVSEERFYPIDKLAARLHLGWDLNKKIVLFFFNGARVKNLPLAKEAIDLLGQQVDDTEMKVIAGVSHDELVFYYNAADLLLLTSLHEGSNNSLKEAIACNCPVVSTNVGDAGERLGSVHPSIVVENHESKDIAAAMKCVLSYNSRCNGTSQLSKISANSMGSKIAKQYRLLLLEQTS